MQTLNLTLNPKQIILDLVNQKNNTNLTLLDVNISLPTIVNPIAPTHVKVTITPSATSNLTGSQDFYYNRINIANIFNFKNISVLGMVGSMLSDVMYEICANYKILLTGDDYFDQSIVTYNPNNVNASRMVVINIKPYSYMFYGTYSLQLGPRISILATPDTKPKDVLRYYFMHIASLPLVDVKKTIVSVDEFGNNNTSFNFLGNSGNITNFVVDTVLQTPDGLTLLGNFSLSYYDINSALITITAQTLIINYLGEITGYNALRLFNPNIGINYESNSKIPYKYVINKLLDSIIYGNGSGIYRYGNNGILDSTFNSVGNILNTIPYSPRLIRITDDGKIYTVSQQLLDSDSANILHISNLIRIDRLSVDGSLDPTFNTVTITGSNTIVDLLPIFNNGFICSVIPVSSLLVSSDVPVVNTRPIVDTTITSINGVPTIWNNLIKVLENGTLDTRFNNTLAMNSPDTIFTTIYSPIITRLISESDTLPNYSSDSVKILSINKQDKFISFNNKTNSISGLLSVEPIVFDDFGTLVHCSARDYSNMYKILSDVNIITQSNTDIVVSGDFQPVNYNGTYADSVNALMKYNYNGSPFRVIFRMDNIALSISNAKIKQIFLLEVMK